MPTEPIITQFWHSVDHEPGGPGEGRAGTDAGKSLNHRNSCMHTREGASRRKEGKRTANETHTLPDSGVKINSAKYNRARSKKENA